MKQFFSFLLLLVTGCSVAQKKAATSPLTDNKNVLVLAILVNNYLKENDARSVDLPTLLLRDTVGRIQQNFEKLVLKSDKGHISAYFKFSSNRVENILLDEKEKEMLGRMRYAVKEMAGEYDGEIQFAFGERFYRIMSITIRKN